MLGIRQRSWATGSSLVLWTLCKQSDSWHPLPPSCGLYAGRRWHEWRGTGATGVCDDQHVCVWRAPPRGSAFVDGRGGGERARACIRGGLGALHPCAIHTSPLRKQNPTRKMEKLARRTSSRKKRIRPMHKGRRGGGARPGSHVHGRSRKKRNRESRIRDAAWPTLLAEHLARRRHPRYPRSRGQWCARAATRLCTALYVPRAPHSMLPPVVSV